MLRALLEISRLELRARFRDGTALLTALVAPIVLASLFGFALGGDDPPLRATVGFVDLDGGEFPAGVREEVLSSKELDGMLTLRDFPAEGAARQSLDAGEIGAVIMFPAGFSEGVGAGRGGKVTVLTSPETPLAGVVATSIVDQISSLVDARTLAVKASLDAGVSPAEVKEFVERNGAGGPSLTLTSDLMAGGKVDMSVYYGSGMAALFAFFVVGTSVRSLLIERNLGTLNRMRAAPIRPWIPIVSKGVVGFVLALVSVCAVWLSSELLFGSTWGDPLAVFTLWVAHVLAAAAITMLVASWAKTDSQADGSIMAVSFVFAFLGGSLVPIYNLPDILQKVALFTPNGWTSAGLTELAGGGGGLATVAGPIAALCGMTLVAGGISALGFRKGLLG